MRKITITAKKLDAFSEKERKRIAVIFGGSDTLVEDGQELFQRYRADSGEQGGFVAALVWALSGPEYSANNTEILISHDGEIRNLSRHSLPWKD